MHPLIARPLRHLGLALVALLLAACGSAPLKAPPAAPAPPTVFNTDGPLPDAPPHLEQTPDAEPRIELVRSGGPNKPYQMAGEVYVPVTDDQPVVQRGLASWYGRKFHGRPTASGELYNMYSMTAAHPTLPIPSYARVRNPANGREVIVRVNDRGPFSKGRIVDLSYTAALKLDVLRGVASVELERITHESIRTGAWRRSAAAPDAAANAPGSSLLVYESSPAPGSPVRTRELWGQELNLAVGTPVAGPTPLPMPGIVSVPPGALIKSLPTAAAAPEPPRPALTPASPAPVQIDPVRTEAGRGWWVQLGAFKERSGALGFQQQVAQSAQWLAPLLALFDERGLHKLQAGPFPARSEAQSALQRMKESLQLTPVLVERR
ncbi:MAG: septal ring lytic transglycosylase RlpA family protein [Burkholderiales bacterium]